MNDNTQTYVIQRHTEAVELQEKVLEMTRLLGAEHPETLGTMNELGWTYGEDRRLEDAAELLEVVWEKRKWVLGDEHLDMLATMSHLAWTYGEQGRLEEAEGLYMKFRVRNIGRSRPKFEVGSDQTRHI